MREATTTRLADSKLVAAVASRALTALAAASVHPAQYGFVLGRQMLRSMVDLDTAGREAAFDPCASRRRPVMAYFDFEAAFPPCDHDFMWPSLGAQWGWAGL